MPTQAKAIVIDELTESLGRAQLTIVADYRGLGVSDLQGFRSTLRPLDAEFRVAKNTLVRIAAGNVGITGLDPVLEGPSALVVAYGDVVGVAKAVSDFARTSRILTVKGGALGTQAIAASDVEALASLPSVDELRGKLVGLLASPLSRTVGVLSGPSRSLAYVLNARAGALGGGDADEAVAAD
jgi:large subunit ribosomal protein L10